jgi:hypothetical protein
MTSTAAFPQERPVNRTKRDAGPSRKSPDSKAELGSEEDRNRGRVNLFAAVAVIVLIAVGWCLVNSFIEMQRARDCYASGALYCSLI